MHNLAKVGAGDTAVQGDMLLPANVEFSGSRGIMRESAGTPGSASGDSECK
jgi:hypothetical protein